MKRLAAFAILFLSAPEAYAYRCSRTAIDAGPSLIWEQRRIEWLLDSELTSDLAGEEVIAAVQASFAAWNEPECSDLELVFGGLRDGLMAGAPRNGPQENAVLFVAGWPYDPAVIALTTNAYDPQTGIVRDGDIEINDSGFTFVDATAGCTPTSKTMDLQNTITHEVGHLIGLDHPPSTPEFEEATMFGSAPPCESQKRTLAQDDIDGLCAIYPAGQPTQQCFLPEAPSFLVVEEDDGFGGCACSASEGAGGAIGLALLGIPLLTRRRSRPR
jgi:MYXO-CTERM domain-containing protein